MGSAKHFLTAAALVFSSFANADLLTLKPGTAINNGVNVSLGASASVDTKSYDLTTVGAGLRTKQVIFNIPVYVAQLMVSDVSRYVKTEAGALPSLANEKSVAIRLNFLRDIPADTVTTSFQDGLDANSVNSKDPDIVQFMALVIKGGDAKAGGTLTIFTTKNDDGTETLAYENIRSGQGGVLTMHGAAGLTHKILSIWLGNAADSGLATLKTSFMN